MQVTRLGYVAIDARDPRAWLSFGPEVLGLQVAATDPDGSIRLRMDEAAYRLLIVPAAADGLAAIGWEVASADALRAAEAELGELGVATERASDAECALHQVGGLVRCTDPAGYRVELFWGMQQPSSAFRPGRPITGFRTGELGLGHIVVGAPQFEATRDFYVDLLGFRLSDFVSDRIVFLHCNPRHHSLGLVHAPFGLRHIMLEVNEIDDVGTGYDVCQSRGVLTRALGRHTNDWMFSFYVMTPSTFEIEYGCNGRSVDDATWQVQELTQTSFWGHQHLSEQSTTRLPEPAAR
jgi:2,3-dihydroxybiphenyl 1,2-dioxygenase